MVEEKNKKKFSFKGISLATLGWEIALPICGGAVVGHYLDRYLETTYMFTLSFLGLGVFIGYYNIFKRIQVEMLRKKLEDDKKIAEEENQ
jgi:F0F1-type ATP synthase assembly protein I